MAIFRNWIFDAGLVLLLIGFVTVYRMFSGISAALQSTGVGAAAVDVTSFPLVLALPAGLVLVGLGVVRQRNRPR